MLKKHWKLFVTLIAVVLALCLAVGLTFLLLSDKNVLSGGGDDNTTLETEDSDNVKSSTGLYEFANPNSGYVSQSDISALNGMRVVTLSTQSFTGTMTLANNTVYKLSGHTQTTSGALLVTSGTCAIDLNGYILASDGKTTHSDASVIKVTGGTLYIIDTMNYYSGTNPYYIESNGRFKMTGSFDLSGSLKGGAIYGGIGSLPYSGSSQRYGGGVYVSGGKVIMCAGSIAGNSASLGGGVYVGNNGSFEMRGGAIVGNYSSGAGGGMAIYGNVTFPNTQHDVTISYNNAGTYGGGIYTELATTTLNGGRLEGNNAQNGGAIFLPTGKNLTLNAVNYSVTNYYVVAYDGGYANQIGGSTETYTGTKFLSNTTTSGDGGGLYLTYGTLSMSGGELRGNIAGTSSGSSGKGGAVFLAGSSASALSTATLNNVTISGNRTASAGTGGGIYISNSKVTLSGTTTVWRNSTNTTQNNAVAGVDFAHDSNSTLILSGTPKIYENFVGTTLSNASTSSPTVNRPGDAAVQSNLGIASGKNVTISGTLGSASDVRITPTAGYTVGATYTSGYKSAGNTEANITNYFSFDNSSYAVNMVNNEVGIAQAIVQATSPYLNSSAYGIADSISGRRYEVGYNTFNRAVLGYNRITVDNEKSIKLLKSISTDVDNIITSTGYLDLNTYTLTQSSTSSYLPVFKVGASGYTGVTFTLNTTGTITGGRFSAVQVLQGATFNMSSGTISGNTAVGTSHAEGGAVRVYDTDSTFNLSGGTITGNTSDWGGAIFVGGGNVNITGGTISNNTCNGDGGAIHIGTKGGTVTISGGSITGNVANGTTYGGGAVYMNAGTLYVKTGASITGNKSASNGGAIGMVGGTSYVQGGTITGNFALGTSSNQGGGFAWLSGGTLEVSGGNVSANEGLNGGAICLNASSATVTIATGASITGNYARVNSDNAIATTSSASIASTTDGVGGGAYVVVGTLNMTGGKISQNSATNGAGMYVNGSNNVTISGSGATISSNTASASGGGIYINKGTVTLSAGLIESNKANGSSSALGGGGVYVASAGKLTMTGGSITSNTAVQYGGGVLNFSANTTVSGGEISANTAVYGGGVATTANMAFSGSATVTGNGNSATTTVGGGIYVNGGTTRSSIAITGNRAVDGAGVYVNNGTFTQNTGKISQNYATGNGGGVYANSTVTLNGTTVGYNATTGASMHGGGLYIASGTTTLTGATSIIGNASKSDGAGVYFTTSGTFAIQDSPTVTNNKLNGTVSGEKISGGTSNNVYLQALTDTTVQKITIAGLLESGTQVGISIPSDKESIRELILSSGYHTADHDNVEAPENDFSLDSTTIQYGISIVNTNDTGTTYEIGLGLPVASVTTSSGTKNYSTLVLAEYAYNNTASTETPTLKLLDNVTGNLEITHTGVIDLGGKMLTVGTSGTSAIWINANDITVTLQDTYTNVNNSTHKYNRAQITGYGTSQSFYDIYTFTNSGTYSLVGGVVTGASCNTGGGVYVTQGSTFIMNGGTIAGNLAGSTNGQGGGGVYVAGTFVMNGGAIEGNAGSFGGGLIVSAYATFTMNGGSISHNISAGNNTKTDRTGTTGYGGAIYNSGTVTINAGTIQYNRAVGAIYASNTAVVNMYGGDLEYNVSATVGSIAGIHLDYGGELHVKNNPVINNNYRLGDISYSSTGVYKVSGSNGQRNVWVQASGNNMTSTTLNLIKVDGALTSGAYIGTQIQYGFNQVDDVVTTYGENVAFTENYSTYNSSSPDPSDFFYLDNSQYQVATLTADGEVCVGQALVVLSSSNITGVAPYATWVKGVNAFNADSDTSTKVLTLNRNGETDSTGTFTSVGTLNLNDKVLKFNGTYSITNGSIFVVANGSEITMTDSTTTTNKYYAEASDGSYNFYDTNGALLTSGSTYVQGGVLTGGQGIKPNGSSGGYGGAVQILSGGTLNMQAGTIAGNIATNYGSTNNARGGGVYVDGGTFSMTGGSIEGNRAVGYGGGVFVASGTVTVNNASIKNNIASNAGTGISYNGTNNHGGGIYATSGTISIANGAQITGNRAARGGGIYANDVTIDSSNISENIAYWSSGGGLYGDRYTITGTTQIVGNTSGGTGGGVFGSNGTITGAGAGYKAGVIIENNSSYGHGGGVYGGNLTITNCTIEGNFTRQNGGGVYITSSTDSTFTDVIVTKNNALSCGGGMYVTGTQFTFTATDASNGYISLNYAGGSGSSNGGGGLYVAGGEVVLSGKAQITSNVGEGGGVYVNNGNTFTMNNEAKVTGNTSHISGGVSGVYLKGVAKLNLAGGSPVINDNYLNATYTTATKTVSLAGTEYTITTVESVGTAEKEYNVLLSTANNNTITVSGTLENGTRIGIYVDQAITQDTQITTGYTTNNTIDHTLPTYSSGSLSGGVYFFVDSYGGRNRELVLFGTVDGNVSEVYIGPAIVSVSNSSDSALNQGIMAELGYLDGSTKVILFHDITKAAEMYSSVANSTVKLLVDLNVSSTITIGSSGTFDLNGRKLKYVASTGTADTSYVEVIRISNNASVTLTDTDPSRVQSDASLGGLNGGLITGGTNGGIVIDGGATLTIEGGNIAGNTSMVKGGGVYVKDGTLIVKGGKIVGNAVLSATMSSSTTEEDSDIRTIKLLGGGVYVGENGNIQISGSPTISTNYIINTTAYLGDSMVKITSNVALETGKTIAVIGVLTGTTGSSVSVIGITVADSSVYAGTAAFTSGYATDNSTLSPTAIFISDISGFTASVMTSGEITWSAHAHVWIFVRGTYDSNTNTITANDNVYTAYALCSEYDATHCKLEVVNYDSTQYGLGGSIEFVSPVSGTDVLTYTGKDTYVTASGETKTFRASVVADVKDASAVTAANPSVTYYYKRSAEGSTTYGKEMVTTVLNAGTYWAVLSVGGLSMELTYNINKADLTVYANDLEIDYGDDAVGSVTYDGLVDADITGDFVTTGNITYSFVGQNGAQYVVGSDVGTYTIIPNITAFYAQNYNVALKGNNANGEANGTLQVYKKTLVISGITSASKYYDGTNSAQVIGVDTATIEGIANNDSITLSSVQADFASSEASTSPIIVRISYTVEGDKKDNYEYDEYYLIEDQYYIKVRNIKLVESEGITVRDKQYDGTTDAIVDVDTTKLEFEDVTTGATKKLTSEQIRAFLIDEGITFSVANRPTSSTSSVDDGEDASISDVDVTTVYPYYNDVNVGARRVSFAGPAMSKNSNNFSLESTSGYSTEYTVSGTITARQVVVSSGITTTPKTYDGNTNATVDISGAVITLPNSTVQGILSSDAQYVKLNLVSAYYDDANAGDAKPVTVELALASNGSNGTTTVSANYQLINTTYTGLTADIYPYTVTVTIRNDYTADKTYDGTNTIVISGDDVQLSDLLAGDDFTVEIIGTYTSKDVGENKTVTIEYRGVGTNSDNYIVDTSLSPQQVRGSISPAIITITGGITAEDKQYDGTDSAIINYDQVDEYLHGKAVYVNGIVTGEEIEFVISAKFGDASVGNDKEIILTVEEMSGYNDTDINNYQLAENFYTGTPLTANITKAKVIVSGLKLKDREYDGSLGVELDLSEVTFGGGYVEGEDISIVGNALLYDKNAGENKPAYVNTDVFGLQGEDAGNYEIDLEGSGLNDLTVTISKIKVLPPELRYYETEYTGSAIVSTILASLSDVDLETPVMQLCNTYEVTVKLDDPVNMEWNNVFNAEDIIDGNEEITIIVKVIPKMVAIPTAGENLNYTGKEQTYLVNDVEDNPNRWYEVLDNTNTEVGDYTAIVRLRDPSNTTWADGTTDDILIAYSIGGIGTESIIWIAIVLGIALLLEIIWLVVLLAKKRQHKDDVKLGSVAPLGLLLAISLSTKNAPEWEVVVIAALVVVIIVLLLLLLIATMHFFKARKRAEQLDVTESAGLSYELSSDSTHYIVTGMGTCKDTKVYISKIVGVVPVTEIKQGAFENATINSIIIPSTITKIGQGAFKGCTALEKATIVTKDDDELMWYVYPEDGKRVAVKKPLKKPESTAKALTQTYVDNMWVKEAE